MTDDRILNQARRELDMPRHAGYILTGAELKRRLCAGLWCQLPISDRLPPSAPHGYMAILKG